MFLQSKHPHVLYEYKDNTPQGCAVTDNNYSGSYERGKRSANKQEETSTGLPLTPAGPSMESFFRNTPNPKGTQDPTEDSSFYVSSSTPNSSDTTEEKVKRDVRSVAKFIEVALVLDKAMFDKRPHSSRKDVIHDAIQVANIADLVRIFLICFINWYTISIEKLLLVKVY